jgi:UDP-glucose 4-epimerase
MRVHLITGGAGFIAVELAKRLLERNETVVAVDNLSRGSTAYLSCFEGDDRFKFVHTDCAELGDFMAAIAPLHAETPFTDVWHLAANSDIPAGVADPGIDLKDTFMTTFNTLKVVKDLGISSLHFASSSAIYGDLGDIAIHEDIGPLQPISNYGAMKLASEAQIRAASEAFLPKADIFRFPNVIGVPATHGVILDFVRKLADTPTRLEVLGNGTQRKPYLHVEDLVDAMLFIADKADGRYNVFNIGPEDQGVTVRSIAESVRDRVSPSAEIIYGEANRGWVGDVPRFSYAVKRLKDLGWGPTLNSHSAIVRAVDQIAGQEGL